MPSRRDLGSPCTSLSQHQAFPALLSFVLRPCRDKLQPPRVVSRRCVFFFPAREKKRKRGRKEEKKRSSSAERKREEARACPGLYGLIRLDPNPFKPHHPSSPYTTHYSGHRTKRNVARKSVHETQAQSLGLPPSRNKETNTKRRTVEVCCERPKRPQDCCFHDRPGCR